MIVFFADRLAAAREDIRRGYEVWLTRGATAGELYHGPHAVPSTERFRVVTEPHQLDGLADYTYVILPSAGSNPYLHEMIDKARWQRGRERDYSGK